MPIVIAFVRNHKVEAVLEALRQSGVEDAVVGEVRGYGRQKGRLELYQGKEYVVSFLPKARVEFFVERDRLDPALASLREAAFTDHIGDGKILVLNEEGRVET